MSTIRERTYDSKLLAIAAVLATILCASTVVSPMKLAAAENNQDNGANGDDNRDEQATVTSDHSDSTPKRTVTLWSVPTHSRIDDGHYQLLRLKFHLDNINSIAMIKVTLDQGTAQEKVLTFKADGTIIAKDPAFVSVDGKTKFKTGSGYFAIKSADGKFRIAIDKSKLIAGFHTALAEVVTDVGTFSDDSFFILKPAKTATPADLVANFLDSDNAMKHGKKYDVVAVENNQGGKAGEHNVSIYLSKDSHFDGIDKMVGISEVDHLKNGEFKEVHMKIEIPSGAPTGSAYLILKVDSGNVIAESNEGNNVLAKSINVT